MAFLVLRMVEPMPAYGKRNAVVQIGVDVFITTGEKRGSCRVGRKNVLTR
jgi:hypothetical protein